MAMKEKRKHARYKYPYLITLESVLFDRIVGRVINMSEGGVYIQVDAPELFIPSLLVDANIVGEGWDGNELVVNGEKILSADICDNAGKCHFSEISYGRVERRFALPVRKVAEDNNSASYNNGILTIEIPYAEMAATQARNISVH